MMNYENAMEYIEYLAYIMYFDKKFHDTFVPDVIPQSDYTKFARTINLATECVGKQVAREPIRTPLGTPLCPECERIIAGGDYCSHCGQKIKWEK